MAWLRKMRLVLVVLGLGLGIATLIGARGLTGSSSANASAKPDAGPRSGGGPVVLGTVDTDPQPVQYGLPPVLQSGTISKVHVKEGDAVKAGQILYEFDARIQKEDVKLAETAVALATTKVNEAKSGGPQHEHNKKKAKLAVDLATKKVIDTANGYNLTLRNLKTRYKAEGFPENTWDDRLADDPTLFKAKVDHEAAKGELDLAKAAQAQLESLDPELKVREAEAAVDQAKAALSKAKAAVELCVVKAEVAGTVERVTIRPGTTLGIGTREPALWLIPSESRVVRAEVEAEFAHRVGDNLKGKAVTIYDHSDPKLTYSGTVLRISDAFLPKRGSAENFLNGDTRVIEVVVEVTDPAPTGKPPLRIGQRVRVNLGQ